MSITRQECWCELSTRTHSHTTLVFGCFTFMSFNSDWLIQTTVRTVEGGKEMEPS
ncbi:unnamed protein product [Rhodiola kirilowii]